MKFFSGKMTGVLLLGTGMAMSSIPAVVAEGLFNISDVFFAVKYGRQFLYDSGSVTGFSTPGHGGSPSLGASIGLNFGPYFGLELNADYYERDLRASGFGKVAEYSVFNVLGQARLRYPVLGGRLVPYVLGGMGYGRTEVNDRRAAAFSPGAPRFTGALVRRAPIYAVGIGADWFFAENLSLGVEAKHVFQKARFGVNGRNRTFNLDQLVVGTSLRMHYPGPAFNPSRWDRGSFFNAGLGGMRPYVSFKAGALFPARGAFHSRLDFNTGKGRGALTGASLGADLDRHVSAELALDRWELGVRALDTASGARVNAIELASWSILPQLKLRIPLMGGRVTPYVLAGAGVVWNHTNDPSSVSATTTRLEVKSLALAASAGGGFDYYLTDNLAVGLEARYVLNRPKARINGRSSRINADVFLAGMHIKAYLD